MVIEVLAGASLAMMLSAKDAQEQVEMGGIQTAIECEEYNILDEYDPDEIDLFARIVTAEAGGEGLVGMRYVACVVLNHVDSEDYPDTITEVLAYPYHFTTYWDGSIYKRTPSDEAYEAIRLELMERTDPDIMYFTAGGYGRYGTPAYKFGNHYFCY